MEDLHSDDGSTRRVTKLMPLNGDFSPLILTTPPSFSRRPRNLRSPHTPIFDPYASSGGSDSSYQVSPPTGFRSLGSIGGALSPIDNIDMRARSLPLLKSPVSIEEDVIVMDGIPVHPSSRTEARRSPSPSWLTENSPYLPERSRLGTKSQLAQGKEELHPSPSHNKKKDEPCNLSSIGAYAIGSNRRVLHHQFNNVSQPSVKGSSAPETWPAIPTIPSPPLEATSSSTALPALAAEASTDKKGGNAEDCSPSSTSITSEYADWCPLDDGIEAPQTSTSSSGKALSREEVNTHIEAALYSPSVRSRLPVFAEFCPKPEELQCLS